jgi:cytosine/adenosine deaminase-related metal-dependent hydrolase
MNERRDIYTNGYLTFDEDGIIDLNYMEEYGESGEDEVIDGKSFILMPGMINLHTHLGMVPFRGLQDDCKDRFRKYLLPMEKAAMSEELVYASSKYAISEMLLGGVTTVMDMYYFEGSAALAAEEMSIRAFLGETIIDEDACDFSSSIESLHYTEQFIEKYKNHKMITPCVAPHATNSCSSEVLKMAYELSRKHKVPFTVHVAEMDYEMEYFQEKYHATPIQFMEQIGVLDENVVAVHCIHLNKEDITILNKHNVGVAHCIGSNTKAAKGVAPVKSMLTSGIKVGLGTDGAASGNTLDIITQLKLFANFHKNENKDRSAFLADEIVAMGTINGAKVLHREEQIGSLEIGKQADLVLLETDSVNMFPIYDPYSTIVYSANASNVSSVYVAGKCVVKNKALVEHDLEKIKLELQVLMEKTVFGNVE